MERNLPAYYTDVSLRLNNVLDKVGLREDVRWKRINMMVQAHDIDSMLYENGNHIFGSQAEATTTPGLQSDFDIVICEPDICLLQGLPSFETFKSAATYLMISDMSTPPGYVKLQSVDTNARLPVFNAHDTNHLLDSFGRSVLCSCTFHFELNYERHGPANRTTQSNGVSIDFVPSMKVTFWPGQASQWENRHRLNNYPSQDNIALIKQTGALLVPAGHPLSPEKHLEWRISISHGEKLLVWQFNSTQYKCYVLLKMMNKHFVQPIVGEKALSSYHCKTCVFYMLESTPLSLWQPENLLLCVELCLRTLCKWVENGYCPNYFIPVENMFHGKVYGYIQVQLLAVLQDLLRQEGKYLLRLSCDGIGQKLISFCQTSLFHPEYQTKDGVESMALATEYLIYIIQDARCMFARQGKLVNSDFLKKICYSHKPRPSVDTVLQAFCSSSFGSHLASQCLAKEVIDEESLDIAHEFLLLGWSSDVASGKLKLAAFYLMQDNLVMAEIVLHQIQENYTYLVTDLGNKLSEHVLCRILEDNLSTAEFLRQYVAFPVPYFRSEIHCTPKALILEMFRSKGSDMAAVNSFSGVWQECAVVDPRFYLHFLEYQCHLRQGKAPQKMAALDNMLWVLLYKSLKYKVTALNMFAYCLKQEGMYVDAYNVLCISMRLKHEHNAAKWQIAFLIDVTFRLLRQRQ